jgi:ParB/RepB/Spo0J family partition protein
MDEKILAKLLTPNPYQPKSRLNFQPEDLADLDTIATIGLQQKPKARRTAAGDVQLLFGHRRAAWWALNCPNTPMPIDVVEADDRQMFEAMIAENEDRLAPNAIERAQTLKAYIDAFGVSQAEAGKLFNLRSQSSVSNLLRLLDLPTDIQTQVASGNLPERHARSLITVARLDPKRAVEAAQDFVEAEDDGERRDIIADTIDDVMRKNGGKLADAPFDLKWDPKMTGVVGDYEERLLACQGCPYRVKGNFEEYCTRPICLKAKRQVWYDKELARVHKATGIALAAKGEKLHDVPVPGYNTQEGLIKALNSKHESLRLTITKDWSNKNVTGSKNVGLKTTDPNGFVKAMGYRKQPETKQIDYSKVHRLAHRRNEIISDALLIVAPAFAKVWPDNLPLLEILKDELGGGNLIPDAAKADLKQAKRPSDQIAALRTYLSLSILDSVITGTIPWDKPNPRLAQKPVESLAQKLKIKLPAKWTELLDQPVIDPEEKPAQETPVAQPAKKAAKK